MTVPALPASPELAALVAIPGEQKWDSYLIDGIIEVMGGPGGVINKFGDADGVRFRLMQGSKRGAPTVETTFAQTLQLGGSRPIGSRSGNRQIEGQIWIDAPGRGPISEARDLLLTLIDQETWELQYTPAGLLPVIYDCFRATVDLDQTSYRNEIQDYCFVSFKCDALPFGRSPDIQEIEVLPDIGNQPLSVALDTFDTVPNGTGWYNDGTIRVQGSASAATWGANDASRSFLAKDLSNIRSIRVYMTMQGRGSARAFTLYLTDNKGKTYNCGMHQRVLAGNLKWEQFTWNMNWPKDFNKSSVTGYRLHVSGGVYLDDLRAMPDYSSLVSSARGGMYSVPGVQGTAPTPINIEVSKASGDKIQRLLIHHPPQNAPLHYTPIVPLNAAQPPDGTQQSMPAIDGTYGGIRFAGTYSVFVCVSQWGGPGNRDITVGVRQYYNDSGVTGADHESKGLTVTVDTSTAIIPMGTMTLPLLDSAADNSKITYTVALTSTVITDRISDVLFLDTRGETLFVSSDVRSLPLIPTFSTRPGHGGTTFAGCGGSGCLLPRN